MLATGRSHFLPWAPLRTPALNYNSGSLCSFGNISCSCLRPGCHWLEMFYLLLWLSLPGAAQLWRGLGQTPRVQAGKATPKAIMSSIPMEMESAHILHPQEFTYSNSVLQQPARASAWLPTWLTGPHSQHLHFMPHGRQPPPFCASPPSQEAAPSVLCLTRGHFLHFVPPSQEAAPSILYLLSLRGGGLLYVMPHRRQFPPFCASPPSEAAASSILCLPSLTGGSPLHVVSSLPHKQPLSFCASPSSEKTIPSILRLITRDSPPQFCVSQRAAPSILCRAPQEAAAPRAGYQVGFRPWQERCQTELHPNSASPRETVVIPPAHITLFLSTDIKY